MSGAEGVYVVVFTEVVIIFLLLCVPTDKRK